MSWCRDDSIHDYKLCRSRVTAEYPNGFMLSGTNFLNGFLCNECGLCVTFAFVVAK